VAFCCGAAAIEGDVAGGGAGAGGIDRVHGAGVCASAIASRRMGCLIMGLTAGSSLDDNLDRLTYALTTFAWTAAPYLAWRINNAEAR
jgi:hypothetical protein